MPVIEVLRPGSSSDNPDYPNEVYWGFTVMIDGQAYTDGGLFTRGTTEATAAASILASIQAGNPPSGVTSTTALGPSGGVAGSNMGLSSLSSGVVTGPTGGTKENKDKDIPKMKTADGT